jgi:ABC-type Fe3+/spermidine/putrescine transport system ATPase subunit
MLLKGDCLVPSLAILNYEYTMDMPRSVTVATGLDALTHAIEAYTSRKASVLTDIYACSAVRRIFRYLPDAYRNGYDAMARKQMAIAAFEAGVCINNSSVTLVHGMSRPIGALFHVPHGMSNAMLLKECLEFAMDVELPLEVMYYSKEERSQRADEMLEMVGLTNFANHFPKQLSGGMQQRVNIARAFGLRPEILLMDEPFSALDEFTKEKLHEDLLRIWRQTNKTILFVTHNIQEAVFLSSRVCVLSPHPGRLSAVVDIDLPRPRTLDMKDTVHFNELVAKVRNSFEGGSV